LVGNVARATDGEEDWLGKSRGSGVVGQQAGGDDADGGHALVPALGHGLDTAAREAGCEDLGGVDVGVPTGASNPDGEIDGLGHHLGGIGAAAAGTARRDGEVAIGCEPTKELGVGIAVTAAATVAPDNDGPLATGGAGRGGEVDRVVLETAVGC
jgi:hypothetical protein